MLRIFDEFFSGFRAKFQKIVTCVAFSIKFAETNQKFAENSEFCEKNSLYYSELFTSLLTPAAAAPGRGAPAGVSGAPGARGMAFAAGAAEGAAVQICALEILARFCKMCQYFFKTGERSIMIG